VELLAIDIIGIIPEDEDVIISTNRGTPVSLEGKSQAGKAFHNIAHRMMGEDIPFIDFTKSRGVLSRIGNFIRTGGGH
jgi:septum site-determining protein MinD